MRVALVHDFLLDLRGAERVFLKLCDMYPEAELFTAVYDPEGTQGRFEDRVVNTSFLQRTNPSSDSFRRYLPLYPRAIESLDLSRFDLVISSSSAWAHGVRPAPDAVHVCYCHNPFRYAWNEREATLAARSLPVRLPLSAVLSRWRNWDRRVARRVDRYVANSEITRERIREYLGRESVVVSPPVQVDRFSSGTHDDGFVVLSELMAHKRIDLAVRACTNLSLPLTVIGDGPDSGRLRSLAGPTVKFVGRISDGAVERRLASARALIVAATEEFGIAAVEAQAAGTPVIALAQGGLLETVVPGDTGMFFDQPSVESVENALRTFGSMTFSADACQQSAGRFSEQVFADRFSALVTDALGQVGHAAIGDRSPVAEPAFAAGR